jgi:hypothetical protein
MHHYSINLLLVREISLDLICKVIDKGGDFVNGFYGGYHTDKKPGRIRRGLTGGFNALANMKSRDFGELIDKIELNE